MRNAVRLAPLALSACLLLAACGSNSNSSTSAAHSSTATVRTASSSLGTILVNARGMTLYRLSGEQNGKFICSSAACTAVWHPLTVAAGESPVGSGVESLGTVSRPDGTRQVTYKGMPLYTFASDQQAGETKGQGFKDVGTWSAVTTGASATTKTSTSPSGGAHSAY